MRARRMGHSPSRAPYACTSARAMRPDGWSQIWELVHAALAKDACERGRFLVHACGENDALRREVGFLLAHEVPGEGFLSTPAVERGAQVMAEGCRSVAQLCFSSLRSHNFAIVQSRLTVRTETSSASAVSSMLKPPK